MFFFIALLTNTPQDDAIIQRVVIHMTSDIVGYIMRKLLSLFSMSDNENKSSNNDLHTVTMLVNYLQL